MKVGDLATIELLSGRLDPNLYIITSLTGMWSGYIVVCHVATGKQYQFLERFIKPLTA